MINILFIISSSMRGGAQVSLLRLISNLDSRRFNAVLYCPPGFLADEARKLGLDVETGRQFPEFSGSAPLSEKEISRL